MTTLQFDTKVINHSIEIPSEYWDEMSNSSKVHVIILVEKDSNGFQKAATEKFFEDFSDKDSIYDQ